MCANFPQRMDLAFVVDKLQHMLIKVMITLQICCCCWVGRNSKREQCSKVFDPSLHNPNNYGRISVG